MSFLYLFISSESGETENEEGTGVLPNVDDTPSSDDDSRADTPSNTPPIPNLGVSPDTIMPPSPLRRNYSMRPPSTDRTGRSTPAQITFSPPTPGKGIVCYCCTCNCNPASYIQLYMYIVHVHMHCTFMHLCCRHSAMQGVVTCVCVCVLFAIMKIAHLCTCICECMYTL